MNDNQIILSENLAFLQKLPSECFNLIYIDPPFNTGRIQKRNRLKVKADSDGTRVGFGGRAYKSEIIESPEYPDSFEDFIPFLEPRIKEVFRILKPNGSFFLHLDPREVHYAKVLCDQIFGRDSFKNEIIWAYDYGARSKTRWPSKHDNILWYAKDPDNFTFNYEEMDRIPYMAPGLVGPEKAALGKTPTDVWWITIVPTNGHEKTGYPTQKPIKLLDRIIKIHSNKGDSVLDFFAGSGTTGQAAFNNGRSFTMVDQSLDAFEIMRERLCVDPINAEAKFHG